MNYCKIMDTIIAIDINDILDAAEKRSYWDLISTNNTFRHKKDRIKGCLIPPCKEEVIQMLRSYEIFRNGLIKDVIASKCFEPQTIEEPQGPQIETNTSLYKVELAAASYAQYVLKNYKLIADLLKEINTLDRLLKRIATKNRLSAEFGKNPDSRLKELHTYYNSRIDRIHIDIRKLNKVITATPVPKGLEDILLTVNYEDVNTIFDY